MPIAPMHEHDYARVAQPLPPTDKHVLVLLTAFEYTGVGVSFGPFFLDWLEELTDTSFSELREILDDLADTEWLGLPYLGDGWRFTTKHADLINKHYPSALEN